MKDLTMNAFIKKYFNDCYLHAGRFPTDLLPLGRLYAYVSHDILDAFINHTPILSAYVAGRYHSDDEEINHDINIIEDSKWVKKHVTTKKEAFDLLTKEGATYHVTPDDQFQDDVHILTKVECEVTGKVLYYYFWYDRDCSDCCIGRFETTDDEETVVAAFDKAMETTGEYNPHGSRKIPLHYFRGWISSK